MPSKTHFLNVDLHVKSGRDLQLLADALGSHVIAMFVERVKRTYHARFELSRFRKDENADVVIRDFCKLIGSLPRSGRTAWNSATRRTFDVGISAGVEPMGWGTTIEAETVQAVAKLGGEIAITVYAFRDE